MTTCVEYARIIKDMLKDTIATFDRQPKLCVIQIGDDPASNSYIKGKKRDCTEVGIRFHYVHVYNHHNEFSEAALISLIEEKNMDDTVDGIIVQLPIPDKYNIKAIQNCIAKEKDVDGFRKDSEFTPCTPKGIIDYLEHNKIEVAGKLCAVIGRSEIVGKPLVNLLIDRGATVVSCNSKTKIGLLETFVGVSDIVISAIGKANYFDEGYFDHVAFYDQILIDVGINRDENGKLCGDITEGAKKSALLATPVPNGVGLLTRVALLQNVVSAYERKEKKDE